MLLLAKDIAFNTEDFSQPLGEIVYPGFAESSFVVPEFLWKSNRNHWEYMFFSFITHARLLDPEGSMKKIFGEMIASLKNIEELLKVRAPSTRLAITRVAVQLFFIVIPLFNEDWITQAMVPFVACLFLCMVKLANEISDPWGNDFHDLPLRLVMMYLSIPEVSETDAGKTESVVRWLNSGLQCGKWEFNDDDYCIPRPKKQYPQKGQEITFEDVRTISQVMGYKSHESFLKAAGADMDGAESRKRRLPGWLKTLRDVNPKDLKVMQRDAIADEM